MSEFVYLVYEDDYCGTISYLTQIFPDEDPAYAYAQGKLAVVVRTEYKGDSFQNYPQTMGGSS